MAHNIDIERAQDILRYRFHNPNLLREALQAATRLQDETTEETLHWHDGNRGLAQLGHKVVDLVVVDVWYEAGSRRGKHSSRFQHKLRLKI